MSKQPRPHVGKKHKKRRPDRDNRRHKNKYEHLAEPQPLVYEKKDKTYRFLAVTEKPGDTVPAGTIILWHERCYATLAPVKIPSTGETMVKCQIIS